MKPNLFRSISGSLAQQFPLLPRIRRSFYGLLCFCCIFIVIGLSESEGLTIPVTPVKDGRFDKVPVARYLENTVTGGQLTIKYPGIIDRIMLSDKTSDLDMVTLLFLAVASIIIIWIVPKLQQEHLFRKDISQAIRLLGYLLMLHGLFSIYRNVSYMPGKIESLTNNEFTSRVSVLLLTWAEFYFALVVIAISNVYKRGVKLQQEQDLTV